MVVPILFIVTTRPAIVATEGLLLTNVNRLILFDDGSVKLNDISLNSFFGIMKFRKVGGMTLTTNVTVTILDVYIPDAACVAVILVVPAPNIVTVFPLIDAIFVLLILYVNAPGLLLVGFVKLNGGSVYFFVEGTTKFGVHVGIVVICILHIPKRNKIKNRRPVRTGTTVRPPAQSYRSSFNEEDVLIGRTYLGTIIFSYGVVNSISSKSCNFILSSAFV